jgi:hypothetical protein
MSGLLAVRDLGGVNTTRIPQNGNEADLFHTSSSLRKSAKLELREARKRGKQEEEACQESWWFFLGSFLPAFLRDFRLNQGRREALGHVQVSEMGSGAVALHCLAMLGVALQPRAFAWRQG